MKKKIVSLFTFAIMLAVCLTAGLIGVSGNDTTADAATSATITLPNTTSYVANSIMTFVPNSASLNTDYQLYLDKMNSYDGYGEAGYRMFAHFPIKKWQPELADDPNSALEFTTTRLLSVAYYPAGYNGVAENKFVLVKYYDDFVFMDELVQSDYIDRNLDWSIYTPVQAVYIIPAEGFRVKFANDNTIKYYSASDSFQSATIIYSDEEGAILEQPFSETQHYLSPISVGDNLRGKTIAIDYIAYEVREEEVRLSFEGNADDVLNSTKHSDELRWTGVFKGATYDGTLYKGFVMPDDKDYIVTTCKTVGYLIKDTQQAQYISSFVGDYSVFDCPAIEISNTSTDNQKKYAAMFPNGLQNALAVYPAKYIVNNATGEMKFNAIIRMSTDDALFNYIDINSDFTDLPVDETGPYIVAVGLSSNLAFFATKLSFETAYYGYFVCFNEKPVSFYGCDIPSIENIVSYDVDGVVTKDRYMKSVEKATAPVTVPEKDGYNFIGWETADGELYDFNAPLAGNVELTAAFERAAVDVTFELETPVVVTTDIGQAVVAPTVPDKTGYTFAGWFTDEALTTAFDLETPITDAMTLYPKYNVNSYTVTYKMSTDVVVNQQYGQAFASVPDTLKTGYTFDGWFTDEALTVAFDKDGTVPAANLTVYPKYTINKYTVTFADGSDNPATVEVNYGELVAIPEAPVKDGYTFNCWLNADGKAFDFEKTAITEDIELTADFEATWQTKAVDWLKPNHKWAAPTAVAVILIIAFGIAIGLKRKH